MDNTVLERVKAIASKKAKSDRDFAILIKCNYKTINQQLKGERSLSLETMLSILSSFEDISAEWLLRGNGDMIIKENITTSGDISKLIDILHSQRREIEELRNEKGQPAESSEIAI